MLINYYDEYRKKLRTPEEAVAVVKSGDWVDYTSCVGKPIALDNPKCLYAFTTAVPGCLYPWKE